VDSHDIDIAVDDCSGVEFAHSIRDYQTSQGMPLGGMAVIQANPDQSKHLETANIRVAGFEIDCVNLRAESYSDVRDKDRFVCARECVCKVAVVCVCRVRVFRRCDSEVPWKMRSAEISPSTACFTIL
jgi:hypothetical protein